jgi:histidinol-phosphate aminotransferase
MSSELTSCNDAGGESRPRVRTGVLDIPAYSPAEAPDRASSPAVRLASNESPLGVSPRARAACEDLLATLERYPDPAACKLRGALAAAFDLKSAHIVCGAGSEELLHLAARAFCGSGDQVVVSQYGFLVHRIAALATGASLVVVPERDCQVDLDAMARAVTPNTRIIYVANPGNPTGTVLSGAAIRDFHARLPLDVLLVLDSAYAEFAESGSGCDYESGLGLLRRGARNLLVTRTFSKMYGLAGLRIGWGCASPEIIDVLGRVRPAFNSSSIAQAAALAALGDHDFVKRSREINDSGLLQLRGGLAELGIDTTDSVCNFVLARFPKGADSAEAAFRHLKAAGVLVRPVGAYGLADCLRISVGLEHENAAVIEGLRAFTGAGHS